MRKNKYTIKELEILNNNPNVVMVKYGNQIEYTDNFKKWAVIQSLKYPELSANQIFEMAGFDTNIIGKRTAESRIRYWKGSFCKHKELSNQKQPKLQNENCDEENHAIFLLLIEEDEKNSRRKWWKKAK